MSLFAAYNNYRALRPDQLELLSKKQMSASRTPAEWISYLGGLAAYDRTADALRRAAGWSILIALVLGFVVAGILDNLLLFLPFLLLMIIAIILYFRLKRDDLPNSMRQTILPLVALLREEMESDAQLHLRFDLTGARRKEKQQGAGRPLPPGRYIKGTETIYKDHWFEGKGTLADGTAAEWSVTDMIREREVTKQGRSGKIKTKTKHKVRRLLDVRVGLRQEDYALADATQSGGKGRDRVAIKEGEKRNVVKLRRIVNENRIDAPFDPRHIFDLLAGAYNRVTLNQIEG